MENIIFVSAILLSYWSYVLLSCLWLVQLGELCFIHLFSTCSNLYKYLFIKSTLNFPLIDSYVIVHHLTPHCKGWTIKTLVSEILFLQFLSSYIMETWKFLSLPNIIILCGVGTRIFKFRWCMSCQSQKQTFTY